VLKTLKLILDIGGTMCSALKFKTKRRRVRKKMEEAQADRKKPQLVVWKCKLVWPVEEVNDFGITVCKCASQRGFERQGKSNKTPESISGNSRVLCNAPRQAPYSEIPK